MFVLAYSYHPGIFSFQQLIAAFCWHFSIFRFQLAFLYLRLLASTLEFLKVIALQLLLASFLLLLDFTNSFNTFKYCQTFATFRYPFATLSFQLPFFCFQILFFYFQDLASVLVYLAAVTFFNFQPSFFYVKLLAYILLHLASIFSFTVFIWSFPSLKLYMSFYYTQLMLGFCYFQFIISVFRL